MPITYTTSISGSTITATGSGATPNSSVGLYIDAVVSNGYIISGYLGGRATANASGAFTITAPNIPSGSHPVTVAPMDLSNTNIPVTVSPVNVTILSSVGDVTEDQQPTIQAQLVNPNDGAVANIPVELYYQPLGSTDRLLIGSSVTALDGTSITKVDTPLPDGTYDFDLNFYEVTVKSAKVRKTISKPNTAPLLPPSYTNWSGANEKWGYLGSMRIGVGAPTGWEVGTVQPINIPKPNATCVVSATVGSDMAGLSYDTNTGLVTVSDPTQLTVAGTRYLTWTWTNSAGSASCTVPVEVVGVTAGVLYYSSSVGDDANAGNLPHIPKKSIPSISTGIGYYRRGDTWTEGAFLLATGGKLRGFGNPKNDIPTIISPSIYGISPSLDSSGKIRTNLTGLEVSFLKVLGAQRALYINGSGSISLIGCKFGNTVLATNSQGVYIRNMKSGDVSVRHCEIIDDTSGDGMYIVACGNSSGTSKVEVLYCKCTTPKGKGGDNLQVTSEGDSSQAGYDVRIAYNEFHNDPPSTSAKGNVVVEGYQRVVIEENIMTGRYFCVSSISNNVTVRNNSLKSADLNTKSFNLGTGEMGNYGDQTWIGNLVQAGYVGLNISGYSDPTGGWQRYDYEITLNTVRSNARAYKQDRKLSGIVQNNVFELNTSTSIVSSGGGVGVATGGDYTTLTLTPNFLNSAIGTGSSTNEVISGTVSSGQTVTVAGGTYPAGGTQTVMWHINDKLVDSTSGRSFVIPSGLADNARVPTWMKTAALSCYIVNTDSAGNRAIVTAKFPDGTLYKTINV